MSTMFKSGDFCTASLSGRTPKLTVWNQNGTKIISEFISSTTPNFWAQIGKLTSQDVVDQVQSLLQDEK